ncbi:MAG: hypothetical protein JNL21_35415 [Myxococcales bacterium]|nr:hypothetical protein [Myxococcales bacterium]
MGKTIWAAVVLIFMASGLSACASDRGSQSELEVHPQPTQRPACENRGCLNALLVDFAGAELPSGAYVLELAGDGRTARCEVSFPMSWRADEPDPKPCQGDLPALLAPIWKNGETVGIESVTIAAAPETLRLSLTSADRAVATLATSPVYQKTQPNGPDCEPTCRIGTATAEVLTGGSREGAGSRD